MFLTDGSVRIQLDVVPWLRIVWSRATLASMIKTIMMKRMSLQQRPPHRLFRLLGPRAVLQIFSELREQRKAAVVPGKTLLPQLQHRSWFAQHTLSAKLGTKGKEATTVDLQCSTKATLYSPSSPIINIHSTPDVIISSLEQTTFYASSTKNDITLKFSRRASRRGGTKELLQRHSEAKRSRHEIASTVFEVTSMWANDTRFVLSNSPV